MQTPDTSSTQLVEEEEDVDLYRNEYVFTFNPNVPCLEVTVFGYHISKSIHDNTERMLQEMKKYNVDKILVDTTYMVLFSSDDQKYFVDDFFPRAIKAGWKAHATVLSKFYFNNVALQETRKMICQKYDQVKYELFSDKVDAREWLKNSEVSDQPSQNEVAQIIQNIDPTMNCDSKEVDVIVLEQETKLQQRVIHAQQQQIENQQKQIEELTKKIQNNL
jgi:hypothetical protein